jgi:hypothetical protein
VAGTIPTAVRSLLVDQGYVSHKSAFNRRIEPERLVHIVWFQKERYDPERFCVNLGVISLDWLDLERGQVREDYLEPEWFSGGEEEIRDRLGCLIPPHHDVWWSSSDLESAALQIAGALRTDGFPFLARFDTRQKIVAEYEAAGRLHEMTEARSAALAAALCCALGDRDRARKIIARAKPAEIHASFLQRIRKKLQL